MKYIIVLIACLSLCGCAAHFGKSGVSLRTIQPPKDAVVNVTYRKIGIVVDYNAANQMPSMTLGYESATYHRVPTGSNVFAPFVYSSTELKQGQLSTDIQETFATGDAVRKVDVMQQSK